MRAVGASALAMALAACGDAAATNNSAGESANQTASAKGTSNAQDAVGALSDGERNGVMIRAIRDAGHACQQVTGSEQIATRNRTPVYMATCEDQSVYAVAVQDDGTMVVRAAMREQGGK